jgi:hypothetical protein
MQFKQAITPLIVTLFGGLLAPNPALAGGVDWARTVKLLKELRDQAQKYQKAFDYALGAADDVKKDKKVRTPPAYKLKNESTELSAMLKAIEVLKPPAPVLQADDPLPKPRSGAPQANKMMAEKLIAFQRLLKLQVEQLEQAGKDLRDIADMTGRSWKAGTKLRDIFSDLHDNPAVKFFFKDAFGIAAVDLEASILPTIAEIKNEAAGKANVFEGVAKERRTRLTTYTKNVRDLLPALGVRVPTDLR